MLSDLDHLSVDSSNMAWSKFSTTVAGTVGSITVSHASVRVIEFRNIDGVSKVYFTVDGSDPTVKGDDCECLPASVGAGVTLSVRRDDNDVIIKYISAGVTEVQARASS